MRQQSRRGAVAAATLGALAVTLCASRAQAFCRTQTCPLPASWSPDPGSCLPPDFDSYCASLDPPAKALPVWWRNACVSYDIQKDASRQVPYATASQMAAQAFAKWTSITCATGNGDAGSGDGEGSARVSIDVRDLGPVSCGLVQYNSDQGNQHVIVFHDDFWPHNDANNTLGLTTITFNPDTGEIYDADMEINATVKLAVGDPVPPDGYDFESVITHESGHFLGLAHSGDDRATMYASYAAGTTFKRILTADDIGGLCSVYLPGGLRAADPSVGGPTPEDACDPTPRHGFSTVCASASKHGCTAGDAQGGAPLGAGGLGLAACATVALLRRTKAPRRAAPRRLTRSSSADAPM
jgi:hypothetical protein